MSINYTGLNIMLYVNMQTGVNVNFFGLMIQNNTGVCVNCQLHYHYAVWKLRPFTTAVLA